MADWALQYWDSPLFFAYLTNQDEAKASIVSQLLERHSRGTIHVIVSSFVIAEVRAVRISGTEMPTNEGRTPVHPMRIEQAEQIRSMFRADAFETYVLTPRIAERAADIGNEYPRLLPGDCVHIATAIESGADVLFTWDGGQRRRPGTMLRYDGRIDGLSIKEPFVPMGPMFDPPID